MLVIALGLKRPFERSTNATGPLMSPKWLTSVHEISLVPGTSRPDAYPFGWMIVLPNTTSGSVPSGLMDQSV